MSDVTLRVPFGFWRDDAARVVRSSLIRGPGGRSTEVSYTPPGTARGCRDWLADLAAKRDYDLCLNTLPGGLVGAVPWVA
jgi:hypothetical protein